MSNVRPSRSDVTLEVMRQALLDVELYEALDGLECKNGAFSSNMSTTPENLPLLIEANFRAHQAVGHHPRRNKPIGMWCDCWGKQSERAK